MLCFVSLQGTKTEIAKLARMYAQESSLRLQADEQIKLLTNEVQTTRQMYNSQVSDRGDYFKR